MLFLLSALYATGAFPGIRTGYGPTSATGLALYFAIIAVVFAIAWLLARGTEMRTGSLRSALHQLFRYAS